MKIAKVLLYVETCMGRPQGGATLRTLDANGELITESVSNMRNALTATYRRIVKRGAHGQHYTCYGKGGWMTNIKQD